LHQRTYNSVASSVQQAIVGNWTLRLQFGHFAYWTRFNLKNMQTNRVSDTEMVLIWK